MMRIKNRENNIVHIILMYLNDLIQKFKKQTTDGLNSWTNADDYKPPCQ